VLVPTLQKRDIVFMDNVRTHKISGVREAIEAARATQRCLRIVETLKGQPPADGKVKSRVHSNGNCGLLLVAALDYLFFLHGDSYVLIPGGSRPIILEGAESVTAETKGLLQRLRALPAQPK